MKRSILTVLAIVSFLAFTSCNTSTKKEKDASSMEDNPVMDTTKVAEKTTANEVAFMLAAKSGSTAKGEASFTELDGKVTFVANLSGLEPGMHAIHIHEKADCSAEDGKSAGGHWNPTHEKHGKWGDADGYHKGDIGNFEADENGNATITITTDEWCIACEDETKNVMGKGIIVHQGEDDFTSQPAGDAGARIACGGIIE